MALAPTRRLKLPKCSPSKEPNGRAAVRVLQRREDDAGDRQQRDQREHAEDHVAEGLLAPRRHTARSAKRLMPERDHEDDRRQHDPDRRGRAHLAGLERAREDLEGRHRGRVAGPAVGGDVDEVEVAQRVDRRQRQRDRDLPAQRRQRDRHELAERARAVDPRRVVQRRRDLLHARGEQHHRQPVVDPRADQPDRRQREREVPQPRLALDPEHAEEAVQRAVVGVVDHLPHHRDDDHRDHLRQEQDRAEQRQPADPRARHHARQQQPDQHRQHRVEDQQDQRVHERAAQLGVREDVACSSPAPSTCRRSARPSRRARCSAAR